MEPTKTADAAPSSSHCYPSERVLEDDYPVHYGYWYVADGEPRQCELGATDIAPATVFELRINWNVGEIRNCDLGKRGMLDQIV